MVDRKWVTTRSSSGPEEAIVLHLQNGRGNEWNVVQETHLPKVYITASY
jgi:hypothetical protein